MVSDTNSNGTSWQQSRLSVETEYVNAPVALRIGGVQVGTLGNFSASIGKAKSKKSFNVSAMAAAALCSDYVLSYTVSLPPDRPVVLYIDTEQSLVDCQRLIKRVLALAGQSTDTDSPNFIFLALRQYTPEERVRMIEEAMGAVPDIGLVIIDGVRDLLYDINNPSESTAVISKLMQWTDRYQFHLHTVLHQNKADEHARGHLGTELANKSETVMLVEKDSEDECVSVVKPLLTRSEMFQPFAFRIVGEEMAMPEQVIGYQLKTKVVGRPAKGKFDPYTSITETQHRKALAIIYPKPGMEYFYKDLSEAVKFAYSQVLGRNVGNNHVTAIIAFLKNKRALVQAGDKKGQPYRYDPNFRW